MKKIIAILLVLMLAMVALAEESLIAPQEVEDAAQADPQEIEVTLEGEADPDADVVTYYFYVGEVLFAVQEARDGEEILRPETDPEAPEGMAFVEWVLFDGQPLFTDAPVLADIATPMVYVEAKFEPVEEVEPAEDAEPSEEPEPAEETEPAEEAEPVAEPEPVDEPELIAEAEPVTEPEPVVEPESVTQKPSPDGGDSLASASGAERSEADEVSSPDDEAEAPTPETSSVSSNDETASPEGKPLENIPTPNALAYTGEAQALVSAQGEWLFSLDGETYAAEIPAAVNAGEYTVYFKAAEDAEPQTLAVTIAKADVVFTPPEAAVGEQQDLGEFMFQ